MSYASFEPNPNDTPEQTVKRLRKLIAGGQRHLQPALAEMLMQTAQIYAAQEKFVPALKQIDEALNIVRKLVKEDRQVELSGAIGRCLLFKAAVLRFFEGPEAGVKAFNEAIDHFTQVCDYSDPVSQNELAVALMSKADLLNDPLGAFSAAIAAVDQAVKIWQRLFNAGHTEYRHPLIASQTALGDAKVSSGDDESAVADYLHAAELALEVIDNSHGTYQPESDAALPYNETGIFYTLYVQSLHKLTKLYDKLGRIAESFDTVRAAIRIAGKVVADGTRQARAILAFLHLHQGMLYEKIHNPAAALEEYNLCRDIGREIFADPDEMDSVQTFMLHNGYANVLMCRGNVLSEMQRYSEADAAFRESVNQYRKAAALQPQGHDDDTLIPYSIGVVLLNHANMLASTGNLDESVAVQKQAMAALTLRIAAGHTEVIPNLSSAYRKIIGIRQFQGDMDDALYWLNAMIEMLEQAVDDGRFEFRGDLASSYQMRSSINERLGKLPEAERDCVKALRLFRSVADEVNGENDVHLAKIQWSEMLQHTALVMIQQQKVSEAIDTMRTAVQDVVAFYEDGNENACVDVLLGYAQFIDMIDGILRSSSFSGTIVLPDGVPLPQKMTEQDFRNEALEICSRGEKLTLHKKEVHKNDLSVRMFFLLKAGYFIKMRGSLLHQAHRDAEACKDFETAAGIFLGLTEGVANLKAKEKFYAAERGEPIPDWAENIYSTDGKTDDPFMDRYIYYVNEYRQTMQFWARSCLAMGKLEEAEKHYDTENQFSWDLVKKNIPNADRFLAVSLSARANSTADKAEFEKVNSLYSQSLELMRMRIQSGDTNWEDYLLSRNLYRCYALYLHQHQKTDLARRVMGDFTAFLDTVTNYPPAELWLSMCQTLDIQENWLTDSRQAKSIRKSQKRLLIKYPNYQDNPELQEYAETLDKAIKEK